MGFRHEYKCLINYMDVSVLRSRLRRVLMHDPHCLEKNSYVIRSLYFDNYMDSALSEKINGTDTREKFRIRYYDGDKSTMKLEKKSKKNGLSSKVSHRISEDLCRDILNGKYESMLANDDPLIKEFYCKIRCRVLRPKSITEYDREAFVFNAGNVRVTIDSGIRGSGNVFAFLEEDAPMLRVIRKTVLEIKWDEYLPQFIRDIVQTNTRMISSFSKYAATRIY